MKEVIIQREERTNHAQGLIQGRYVGRKGAAYLKTHTHCTKGHGWTERGSEGGCAKCEATWKD